MAKMDISGGRPKVLHDPIQFHFQVERELMDKFRQEAARRSMSLSDLFREYLREELLKVKG